MKQRYNIGIFALLICLAAWGCKRYDDDYKRFLAGKEKVYPGLASKFRYYPGNLRVKLVWTPSPDPSITSYVVKWNNGLDSAIVPATTTDPADSISTVIDNLKEYVYSFKLITLDKDGNRSIGQNLDNVRVYGSSFAGSLTNRPSNPQHPYVYNLDGSVTLNFIKADPNNVSTAITYTDNAGAAQERTLLAADTAVVLPNFKYGTAINYRSSYLPVANAIDNFKVPDADTYPTIYPIADVNKGQMKAMSLPSDIRSEYGWVLPYLWDNNYNEPGFHTPGQSLPFWITIDLGSVQELARLRIWQRMSGLYNYGNVKRFEIWGTNSPNSDGTFNGWTRLGSFQSIKPSGLPKGQTTQADADYAQGEPFTFLPGVMPVRYIRFKVLETWGGDNYFHAIEFTFARTVK
ncbi:hypothetical protein D0C36_03675 [Mucilaginibacter conchicola]|uniref:DUF5000 domain-containing protein n=1 Tax=Mucilaginibacter conchicola TaxID=2303333 RepID=A0A372NXQ3_9SPHI|nr:DUF4998 domain-containing protein [Mucilaginibacter conchicola]RFZ94651.1 hypothetical protein D0C36_03675 [Mucilaginibacter conchicola]